MVRQYPTSIEEFGLITQNFKNSSAYKDPLLFAIGGEVRTKSQDVLASVRYPFVNGFGENTGSAAILMKELGIKPEGVQNIQVTKEQLHGVLQYFDIFNNDGKTHKNIDVMKAAYTSSGKTVATFIFDDIDPVGVEDSTLKLYGLSTRKFKPNTLNFNKVFTKLPNVAWQGDTPLDEQDVQKALMEAAFQGGNFSAGRFDKFPLYAHRINALEMGVRITDEYKVRLGAYLGEGTVVMAGASFVNFNAGSEGPNMIEGRVSSSAWIGKGTDIGGGASMLGTLSGGNSTPISTGRNCLLEVNSCLGIPIGDAVIIAAETAVLASSLVKVNIPGHPKHGQIVKGAELVDINAVTFRRRDASEKQSPLAFLYNGLTGKPYNEAGQLEVVRTKRNEEYARKLEDGETILNKDLH